MHPEGASISAPYDRYRVSVPGRTEVAGNHQDHQGGCVIASAIDRHITCEVYKTPDSKVKVLSPGFKDISIDTTNPACWTPRANERNTTISLVRGIVAQLMEIGVGLDGCTIEVQSNLPAGSGLSSSAAFELAIGASLLAISGWELVRSDEDFSMQQEGKISLLRLAQMGLHAERAFFGKPCGIMDQIACAFGGVIHMDFRNRVNPVIHEITLPPSCDDYFYYLVDTGFGHDANTEDFAQVANDMQTAADAFGVAQLRDISLDEYLAGFSSLRDRFGNLVALRGLAFFEEYDLVERRLEALREDNADRFVELANRSSMVSSEHLQNVGIPGQQEGAEVGLAVCQAVLGNLSKNSLLPCGSARIHGGGFGGTIQALVPAGVSKQFEERVNAILGDDSCHHMNLDAPGVQIEPCTA